MGKVYKHAHAIHFFDKIAAGRAKTMPIWFGNDSLSGGRGNAGSIGINIVTIPGKRGIPDSKLVIQTEGR
jgi:hypothetical protein